MKAIKVNNEQIIIASDSSTDIIRELGSQGPPGKSPYQLALEGGFEGTIDEWLSELKATIEIDPSDAGKIYATDGSIVYWADINSLLNSEADIVWDLGAINGNNSSTILFKQGDTATNDGYVGGIAEVTLDTETNKFRIHDGVTVGGHVVPNMSDIQLLEANKADKATVITAGEGLVGGGDLSQDRTFNMGVPSTISISSTNTTDATSHSHELSLSQSDIGLSEVDNTSDVNKPVSIAQQAALDLKVDKSTAVHTVNGYIGNVVLTKADVGLPNADNTSDVNKPVSTAQQAALDLKANADSPSLTGIPTTPTAALGTNTGQVASTEFVITEIAQLNTGVSSVTGNAPIVMSGTSINPVININNVTTTTDGAMIASDKAKLDAIEAGSQVNTVTSVSGRVGDVVVTKADVGLGSVDDYPTTTYTQAVDGTSTSNFTTPQRVRDFIENGDYVVDGGSF